MSSLGKESRLEVGNLALARFIGAPAALLRRTTYVAGTRDREVVEENAGVKRVESGKRCGGERRKS